MKPACAKLLARILQRAGFEVTTAINGTEGFSLVSQHLFDMVYLDIRMPDVSGLELLKSIHAKYPDLPVILFTAQPDLNSAVEASRSGATEGFSALRDRVVDGYALIVAAIDAPSQLMRLRQCSHAGLREHLCP